MGYTHYWNREQKIAQQIMESIVNDFRKIVKTISLYVDLAGGSGEGNPEITYDKIWFNGKEKCGHPQKDLGIAWPDNDAGGIANPFSEVVQKGTWFAGSKLQKRTCGGDCSHETMYFPRIMKLESYNEPKNGLYFNFCETAFKPYDLAVISLLIIAKHYLNEKIKVSSDGTEEQWFDGKFICQQVLGYGLDFKLKED